MLFQLVPSMRTRPTPHASAALMLCAASPLFFSRTERFTGRSGATTRMTSALEPTKGRANAALATADAHALRRT